MRQLIVLLMLSLIGCAQLGPSLGSEEGYFANSVKFLGLTPTAKQANCRVVSMRAEDSKDYTSRCSGDECRNLEWGRYYYEVELEQYPRRIKGQIWIDQRRQIVPVPVGIRVDGGNHDILPMIWRGRLSGQERGKSYRLLVRSMFEDHSAVVPISADGTFEARLGPGYWVAVVFDEDKVLQTLPFWMQTKLELTIKIEPTK